MSGPYSVRCRTLGAGRSAWGGAAWTTATGQCEWRSTSREIGPRTDADPELPPPRTSRSKIPSVSCSGVRLMVHASQVQEPVQHQNAQLFFDAVAEFGRLSRGSIEGDGQLRHVFGRKGKHVCRVIFPSKGSIQTAQFRIWSNQTGHFFPRQDAAGKIAQKLAQIASTHPRRRVLK